MCIDIYTFLIWKIKECSICSTQIQQVRALLNFEQNDRFCISINKRSNTNSEDETLYLLCLGESDSTNNYKIIERDENGAFVETTDLAGSAATEAFYNLLKETPGFNTVDYTGDDPGQAPVITSSDTFSANENTQYVGTVVATDADGDTLRYDVGQYNSTGDGTFNINVTTGELYFDDADGSDYEIDPVNYNVEVIVSDANYQTTQQLLIQKSCKRRKVKPVVKRSSVL